LGRILFAGLIQFADSCCARGRIHKLEFS
jgi:hypothetical protein